MIFKFMAIPFLRSFGILLIFGMLSTITFAASPTRFQKLYDHYFPKKPESVLSGYRKWFDRTVFNPRARNDLSENDRKLYDAVRGDPAAFHAFVHSNYRGGSGEFGETWSNECVLLLLVLGDERFAHLLAQEDKKTKALVRDAIFYSVDWRKHPFPKTRNLF